MARWNARVYGYAKSGSGTGNVSFNVVVIADTEYEARESFIQGCLREA